MSWEKQLAKDILEKIDEMLERKHINKDYIIWVNNIREICLGVLGREECC